MTVCPDCGASIFWASTRTGRRLPLDSTPAPSRTLSGWVLDGEVARMADPARDASAVSRYRHHWVTCTHARPTPAENTPPRTLPARGPERQLPGRSRR